MHTVESSRVIITARELKRVVFSYRKFNQCANIGSLWTRYRAPTSITMLNNPLRYVLELSNTTFLGAQRDALGFNYLTTVGAGFELDSSDYPVFITRTRIIYRYTFGENVSGFALALAMSF